MNDSRKETGVARHTPGPWCVEQCVSEREYDICLGYEVPNAGSPIMLASVFDDADGLPGEITIEQALANARLIAAAPDLLEALQEVMVMWGSEQPTKLDAAITWRENDERAHGKARAAIAKATGKEAIDA